MKHTQEIKHYLQQFQNQVCQTLEAEDKSQCFTSDTWAYDGGGGGDTRVLENGGLIERGGVNFSHIKGDKLPAPATEKRPHLADSPFEVMGVSLVIHPWNPYIPTVHANFRFFEARPAGSEPVWWFGGGFDLTPYYGFDEDCILWHQHAHAACETLDSEAYSRFKQWCDDYFYLPHRQENRGIGGLFFDDVNEWPFERCLSFIQSCGAHFIDAYHTIIQRRQGMPYSQRERGFQCYRRGRYVEFNLLFDRGTLFGIKSGGRTESILVSMPPAAQWRYNWHPEPNSPEAKLYERYLKPQNWLELETTHP